MRILHTSDWHLGQNFYTKNRLREHRAFLAWLREQVVEQEVDAVIIAGDIFDTGSPPSYARELYNQFIGDMQEVGCQLLLLGGNHDSVTMLNESRGLLARLNTCVIPGVMDNLDEQVVVLKERDGTPGAVVCAIPFIRPRDVLISQAGQSGRDKQNALQLAISEHYSELYARAAALRTSLDVPVPIVATGHLTAMGVTPSESERDIYIGTLEAFPAKAFPPADYIALGHIHRPQRVAKSKHIRYSGSPIPLSFDELGAQKSVVLVDFYKGKRKDIRLLDIPRFQAMERLKGSLEAIEKQLAALGVADGTVWLDIEVAEQDYLSDLQPRIEAMTEGLPVEVVRLHRARSGASATLVAEEKETLEELSEFDVFERRLAQETFDGEQQIQRLQRLRECFREVVEEVRDDDDGAPGEPEAPAGAADGSTTRESSSGDVPGNQVRSEKQNQQGDAE
ncbi:MAG: exonuclease subunit SbcD [bacterium]